MNIHKYMFNLNNKVERAFPTIREGERNCIFLPSKERRRRNRTKKKKKRKKSRKTKNENERSPGGKFRIEISIKHLWPSRMFTEREPEGTHPV